MATARFIAGPVARKIATAIGSSTPEAATGTSSRSRGAQHRRQGRQRGLGAERDRLARRDARG